MLRGRYFEGQWAELKLIFFALIAVGAIASFYRIGVELLY